MSVFSRKPKGKPNLKVIEKDIKKVVEDFEQEIKSKRYASVHRRTFPLKKISFIIILGIIVFLLFYEPFWHWSNSYYIGSDERKFLLNFCETVKLDCKITLYDDGILLSVKKEKKLLHNATISSCQGFDRINESEFLFFNCDISPYSNHYDILIYYLNPVSDLMHLSRGEAKKFREIGWLNIRK